MLTVAHKVGVILVAYFDLNVKLDGKWASSLDVTDRKKEVFIYRLHIHACIPLHMYTYRRTTYVKLVKN